MSARRIGQAFGWVGGKSLLRIQLYEVLDNYPHRAYCEPYGGSGVVLLGKKPSTVEIFNDIDSDVINFFRIIAHPDTFRVFWRRIRFLPLSIELFRQARERMRVEEDQMERAIAWYYVAANSMCSRLGAPPMAARVDKGQIEQGMAKTWISRKRRLKLIHKRLEGVFFDCRDAMEVIEDHDNPQTLFYLDPPYVPQTLRSYRYRHHMTVEDHMRLVDRLLRLKGAALLSGYQHEVYEPLTQNGWCIFRFRQPVQCMGCVHKSRRDGHQGLAEEFYATECVWASPRIVLWAAERADQLVLWKRSGEAARLFGQPITDEQVEAARAAMDRIEQPVQGGAGNEQPAVENSVRSDPVL